MAHFNPDRVSSGLSFLARYYLYSLYAVFHSVLPTSCWTEWIPVTEVLLVTVAEAARVQEDMVVLTFTLR